MVKIFDWRSWSIEQSGAAEAFLPVEEVCMHRDTNASATHFFLPEIDYDSRQSKVCGKHCQPQAWALPIRQCLAHPLLVALQSIQFNQIDVGW